MAINYFNLTVFEDVFTFPLNYDSLEVSFELSWHLLSFRNCSTSFQVWLEVFQEKSAIILMCLLLCDSVLLSNSFQHTFFVLGWVSCVWMWNCFLRFGNVTSMVFIKIVPIALTINSSIFFYCAQRYPFHGVPNILYVLFTYLKIKQMPKLDEMIHSLIIPSNLEILSSK